MSKKTYAIIGAGPCGLAMARCFQKKKINYKLFEYHSDVGGIWNQENPMSTMYDSAHLISSKTMTQFDEFPFSDDVADFPHQKVLKQYFIDFASKFNLRVNSQFNTLVKKIEKENDHTWRIEYQKNDELIKENFDGVVLAAGLFNKGNENIPKWPGMENFKGKIVHSSDYRSNDLFADKNVLIVGCGNSAADITIDAVHRAKKVHMSVRRGYYFVPKYIFGKPMDTLSSTFKKLIPNSIHRPIEKKILKWFAGDPQRFGFPRPEYDLFESHPVVNSYLLQHVGHGDIKIVGDIDSINEVGVQFKNGQEESYDIILLATGYHLTFNFIDKKDLNWKKACPDLHLNIFSPTYDNLFVLGMIEATGIGWQGRYDQAELVAEYIDKKDNAPNSNFFQEFEKERKENNTDLFNGMNYIKLDRMAYYVHKEHYMRLVKDRINNFKS